jgi:hypothetical protein
VRGAVDIETIISAHPELAADIGKVLEAHDAFRSQERRFGRELKFEASRDRLVRSTKESATEMLWRAPADWFRESFRGTGLNPFKMAPKMFVATAKLMAREVWQGGKFLATAADTIGQYINTKRK